MAEGVDCGEALGSSEQGIGGIMLRSLLSALFCRHKIRLFDARNHALVNQSCEQYLNESVLGIGISEHRELFIVLDVSGELVYERNDMLP
ncbi:MAG: hypothetical protein LBC69_00915 [Eubacteriaceae bacterium]|jgi:hypothetical protein|nr:hypothetical protein [Eubacteriaceae bacterium]